MHRNPQPTLFEVSWEVCRKVGGIHTVISTKARRLAGKLGDAHVVVGPWVLSSGEPPEFEPERGFDSFADGCRAAGVPVLVGRWKVPGRPRALLVEFSGLYQKKDDLFRQLWDRHGVDSLFGDWDYVEPVLFGHAAAIAIERWWREGAQGAAGPAVAQFHEWMTASGLLELADRVPEIGSVFTAHATVLGRALAATGVAPLDGLGGRTPDAAADVANVRAKHSLEAAAVRRADVFTTVSDIAADEARLFHGRDADVVLPNGWDAEVMAERTSRLTRADAARRLRDVASRFLGEDVSAASFVLTTGRYELHNKGFDVVLDAAGDLQSKPGRPVVLVLIVPAGNGGLRREVAARMQGDFAPAEPLGIATHALFDPAGDAIARRCAERGLTNAHGSRVRVIHVPRYLAEDDLLFHASYEALLQGADLTVFPSFYDAWGYTPEESLAVGVPTVTTDCTGFGRWMRDAGTPKGRGLTILHRRGRSDEHVRARLVRAIERHLEGPRDDAAWSASSRELAMKTEWQHLLPRHEEAHRKAREIARKRSRGTPTLPPAPLPPAASTAARPRIFALDVAAVLPAPLTAVHELVRNWHWTWDPDAVALLAEISPATWERVNHDPLRVLREAPAADLEARAADEAWCARLTAALGRQRAYLAEPPHDHDGDGASPAHPVVYVCAEYGIHESLPIYSGGLGALAGDHLKSASDLRIPLAAVGLLYRRGYFHQRLEGGTTQTAGDDRLDPGSAALEPVRDASGRIVEVALSLPGTTVLVRGWRAAVGRVPLYLLDTDVEGNRPEDREITHRLYGGDTEHRLRQEIVLGFGGIRFLAALGIEPSCVHVNEGHGAFASLERVRTLVRDAGLSFDEAREVVHATTAFTTHTPVPAGHDRFGEDLIRRYFSDAPEWLKIPWERLLALGTVPGEGSNFVMTRLATEFAASTNGVSRKHGEVSRALLRPFAPSLLEDEIPVSYVTNGVHVGGWTDARMARALGATAGASGADFRRAADLALPALWDVRRALRSTLLGEVRERIVREAAARGDSAALAARMAAGLDGSALLLGFARRFATYKRADLLFRDPARLRAILDRGDRPVRVFFAGKAHPRDAQGQELIARIARLARSDEFAGRVFVLENYDLGLARRLVAGVDVWLNNPRAPQEASGTSGMKAACNGVLNLSVADGWWIEGFDSADGLWNGWRIGDGTADGSDEAQDARDAASLLALLEHDVVPLFFRRDAAGVPSDWLARVRNSLVSLPPVFDTARMVGEYRDLAYGPFSRRYHGLRMGEHREARALAARRARVHRGFATLRIVAASVTGAEGARPGDAVLATLEADLGELGPGDVVAEMVAGPRDAAGEIRSPVRVPLVPSGARTGTAQRFEGAWTVPGPGAWGYGLRVRPLVDPDDDRPRFDDPVLWA